MRGSRRVVATLALLASASLFLTACGAGQAGNGKSVKAFCKVVEQHKSDFTSAMSTANANLDSEDSDDAMLGLLQGGGQIAGLGDLFSDLAEAAPEEIEDDAKDLSKSWDDTMGKAITLDFKSALSGSVSMGSQMKRVNNYIADKCGEDNAPFGGLTK